MSTDTDEIILGIDNGIDEALTREFENCDEEGRFIPQNEADMDYIVRKIHEDNDAIDTLKGALKKRVDIIKEEFADHIEILEDRITSNKESVELGLDELDRKSMTVPSGKAYKKFDKSIVWPDKATPGYKELLDKAEELGVDPRQELNKSDFKKHFEIVGPDEYGNYDVWIDGEKSDVLKVDPKKSVVIQRS